MGQVIDFEIYASMYNQSKAGKLYACRKPIGFN